MILIQSPINRFNLIVPIIATFYISALLFTTCDATPVTNSIDDDDWNYKIKPHSTPLLQETSKNHILPPISQEKKPTREKVQSDVKTDRQAKKLGDAVRSKVSCPICKLGVGLLNKEIEKKTSQEDIKVKFVGLCVSFKIESEDVCTGIFNVFGPEVLAALEQVQIGPVEICSLFLGEVCGDIENPLHDWQVDFPDVPKPNVTAPPTYKEGLPTFKVLQLSDTHFDPEYAVGSPANCEEPLCCRSSSTPPEKEETVAAGKWGSYLKCDSPRILIENMLQHISQQHPDIDYIIWTGDLPPHDIWNQTKDSNLNIIQETVEQMFEHFPNTPIFPVLGNHEAIPAGSFAPPWMRDPEHSIAWLYTRMADHWRKWLPASSGNTVLHGGFYSVLIRPGFRIIALNTNYCHTLSWWLAVNSTDPAHELQWLIHELQEAELNSEKVHLIGHIAPGSADCMKVWSRNFNLIVERYESTITGQFYGHSHADEFQVFYQVEDISKSSRRNERKIRRKKAKKTVKFTGRPISVAYLGPSVTTFEDFNPAYRLYYVDGDHHNTTREVIDHETWTMDLDAANKNDKDPEWYRLYSAKNSYMLDSLRPSSWAKLIEELVEDSDLFELFYKFYYRDSPVRPSCDTKCKLQLLCDLKSGRSHSRHELCHDLELTFSP